jgi:hypothetical protein
MAITEAKNSNIITALLGSITVLLGLYNNYYTPVARLVDSHLLIFSPG